MKIILFGAPGTGKGTQASFVSESLGVPAVSTGNLIRDAIASGHPKGPVLKGIIDHGHLVPDTLVIGLLQERLSEKDCASGCVLDGFPRTIYQAKMLSDMGFKPDLVISMETPDDIILQRAAGRRICKSCGESYHLDSNPPKTEGICDKCGGDLTIREDDRPETVRHRLAVFYAQTAEVKAYYEAKSRVYAVNSSGTVEQTTETVRKLLEKYHDQH